MAEKRESYPMWVYKDGEKPRLVEDAKAKMDLGKGWKESPAGLEIKSE